MFVLELSSEDLLKKLPKELIDKWAAEQKDIEEMIKNFAKNECNCPRCVERRKREANGEKVEKKPYFMDFVDELINSAKTEEKTESKMEKGAPDKEDKRFWMVWSPTGNTPKYKHVSHGQAMNEAKRLATKNPNSKFYVLEATDEIETTVKIESNKL